MLPRRMSKFLKKHKVVYDVISHPETFTSSETAEAERVSGHHLAKVVMVKADGQDLMAVLPASCSLDLLKLSSVLGTKDVRIEEEGEFQNLFPDCELGAMPPFGRLYQVPCYVDRSLTEADWIAFNAGNHHETVRMPVEEFFRILNGKVVDMAVAGRRLAGTSAAAR